MVGENVLKEVKSGLTNLVAEVQRLEGDAGKLIDLIQDKYRELQKEGNREPDDFIMISLSELDKELTNPNSEAGGEAIVTHLRNMAEWIDSLIAYTDEE